MPLLPLDLSGGFVNARLADPRRGELAEAAGVHYLPGDPRLRGNRGRRFYGGGGIIPGSTTGAMRFLRFGSSAHRLLALCGSTLYVSDLDGPSGSFISLGDVVGHQMAAQQYKDQHLLYFGVNANKVFRSDGDLRDHGIPEQPAPSVTSAAGSGPAAGTYQYWVTGYDEENDFESAAAASTAITVDGTVTVTVHQPSLLGLSRITKWRVYRSPEGTPFPNGNRLDPGSGIALTTTTFADTGLPAGVSYPTVATSFAGLDLLVSRNSPPPIGTFAFVLDDSLVQNDIDDPHRLVYSFPLQFEAFPSEFYNVFKEDALTAGLGVGTYGLVFGDSSLWRLNSVSRAQDAEFSRGRLLDPITKNYGCPSALGCCTFEMPQGVMGGFASRSGPMITDGSSWDTMTDDIDWEKTADLGTVGTWVMVNNPTMHCIELFYSPATGNFHSQRMRLSYDPYHLKGRSGRWPGLKVMGSDPLQWDGADVCIINGRWETLTLAAQTGRVYRENVGSVDEAGGNAMRVGLRTSSYPLGTLGTEGSCSKVWLDHEPSGKQRVSVFLTDYAAERKPIEHSPADIGVEFDGPTSFAVDGRGNQVDLSISSEQEDGQLVLRGLSILGIPGGLEEGDGP